MGRWTEAGSWEGDGLRREVFFFRSDELRLFGSLYAAAPTTLSTGVVVCPSWGVEADRSSLLAHGLALATARLGGAGLVYHHPGYGDSEGDAVASTMDVLARAAADAASEAARRAPGLEWTLAGFTFGAAVACLAWRESGARGLLLLQPHLRPGAYFDHLARRAERSVLRSASGGGMAFGYPVPHGIAARGAEADAAVAAALADFDGEGAAVRYSSPEEEGEAMPARLERVVIPGTWRFGARHQPGMREAAVEWLRSRSPAVEGAAP